MRIETAIASGMEWFTAMNSMSKGPSFPVLPGHHHLELYAMRCSRSFGARKASVSREP